MVGIYKITNQLGGIYVGASKNIHKRKTYYAGGNCRGQRKLYESITLHGWENHSFEIVVECDISELERLEIHYIKHFDTFDTESGMNLQSGGNNPKDSTETRIKRGNAIRGRKLTQEWKEKIGLKSKGRMVGFKHSAESIEKMKVWKRVSRPNPYKGTGMSKEEKRISHNLRNKEYRLRLKNKEK